jgi:hypothetical protein
MEKLTSRQRITSYGPDTSFAWSFYICFCWAQARSTKITQFEPGELRDTIFETYLRRRYDHEARKLNRKPPFTLEAIYEVLGRLAMEDAGGGGNQNVFKLDDFSRVFERDTAHQFVEFLRLLNILIWQNENLRFIHLRMRDFFAFKYAQTVLFNGDPETRDRAAWALWQIPDERVVLLLIEALKDPYEYVRTGAVGALGRIGDVRAIEPLKELLTDNTPVISIYGKRVCDVAAVALKMIGTREAD